MRLLPFRWLLLLVFVFEMLDPEANLPNVSGSFIWLTLLALLACALLLTLLDQPLEKTLWVWVILFVFIVGDFLKVFLVGRYLYSPEFMLQYFPELRWLSIDVVANSYVWIVFAFTLFCVTGWVLLSVKSAGKASRIASLNRAEIASTRALLLLIAVFLLTLVAGALQASLGLGVLGTDVTSVGRLPLGLDTLITRFITDVSPAILLIGIWAFDVPTTQRKWLLAMAFLGAGALMYTVLSTSRGGLVRYAVPVFLLWLLTDRFTRSRKVTIALVLIMTVLIYQFVSALRYERVTSVADIPGAVSIVLENQQGSNGNLVESVTPTIMHFVFRISGAEGVWYASNALPDKFQLDRAFQIVFVDRMSVYYTRSIVGVLTEGDFRAPGIVGAFMLLGGTVALGVLLLVYLLGTNLLWTWASKLKSAPVALALTGSALVFFTSEGGLVIPNIVSLLFSIALCELLFRYVFLKRTNHRAQVAQEVEAIGPKFHQAPESP